MEKARQAVEERGFAVLFTGKVKVKKRTIMSRSYMCVVADSKVFFFKGGSKEPYSSYSYLSLTDFTEDSTKLTLNFNDTILVLTSTRLAELSTAFRTAFSHVLTSRELASFSDPKKIKSVRSNYGAFCRLRETIESGKSCIDPRDEEMYTDVLVFREPSVTLSADLDVESARAVVDILEMADGVQVLIVESYDPERDSEEFRSLAKDRGGIRYLDLRYPLSSKFGVFCDYLAKNKQSAVTGAAFRNADLERYHLNKLRELTIAGGLQCLDFESSIDRSDYQFMYKEFFPSLSESSLISVSMDGMNIDLDELLESLPYVRFLSVANCGLCVCEALKAVCNYRNILRIDISHNVCKSAACFDFVVPDTLKDVIADFISFEEDSFSKCCLFLLQNMPRKSLLSLRCATSTRKNWDELFLSLPDAHSTKLSGLIWDGNIVKHSFIRYLSRGVISYLSVSGCFLPNNISVVSRFCTFLANSTTLTDFVCCGDADKFLADHVELVLRAVVQSRSLRRVNLDGNHGTMESLAVLQNVCLAKKRARLHISIDGLAVQASSDLLHFLSGQFLSDNGWRVQFPTETMKKLLRNNAIDVTEYETTIDLFREETAMDSIKPFHVRRLFDDNDRPFYLTERARELLRFYPNESSYTKESPSSTDSSVRRKTGSFLIQTTSMSQRKTDDEEPSGAVPLTGIQPRKLLPAKKCKSGPIGGMEKIPTLKKVQKKRRTSKRRASSWHLNDGLEEEEMKEKTKPEKGENIRTRVRTRILNTGAKSPQIRTPVLRLDLDGQWPPKVKETERKKPVFVITSSEEEEESYDNWGQEPAESPRDLRVSSPRQKTRRSSALTTSRKLPILPVKKNPRRSDGDAMTASSPDRAKKRRFRVKKKPAASQMAKVERRRELFVTNVSPTADYEYDDEDTRTLMQKQVKSLIANPIGVKGVMKAGSPPKRNVVSTFRRRSLSMPKGGATSYRVLKASQAFKDDDQPQNEPPSKANQGRKLTDTS